MHTNDNRSLFQYEDTGPVFTKRTDVLPQDFAKSGKARDSGLNFSNCSEICPRQHRCPDPRQISEQYDPCNTQSRGFRDFAWFGGKTPE